MAFCETLTYLRKLKGLSQEQLAQELDITRQTISKWELNQSTPDIDYLLRLSEYFEVSTDYLLKGRLDEDMKKVVIPMVLKLKKENVLFIYGVFVWTQLSPGFL